MSGKIISIILAASMIFSVVCVIGSARDDALNYLTYEITDGEATITGCAQGVNDEIIIPDSIDGYPVTAIGDSAFFNYRDVSVIVLPKSVTKIGDYAFCNTELTDVTIPDSVISIGDGAFQYCYGLESIAVPGSVAVIGNWAFYECTSLSLVTINIGTECIGNGAFGNCSSLTSIMLPDSVTDIGEESIGYQYNISEWDNIPVSEFIIYGIRGSAADRYARKNGLKFSVVNSEEFLPEISEVFSEEADSTENESVPMEIISENISQEYSEPVSDEAVSTDLESTTLVTTTEYVSEELETESMDVTETVSEDESQTEIESVSEDSSELHDKIKYLILAENTDFSIVQSMFPNGKISIFLPDDSVLSYGETVGTGCTVRYGDLEYSVIVLCDVDGNGKITAADARLTLRVSAQLDMLNGVYLIAANVDTDSRITAADARRILRVSARLETL